MRYADTLAVVTFLAARGFAADSADPLLSMQSHCIKLMKLIPDMNPGSVLVTCQKERLEWRKVAEAPTSIENRTTYLAGLTNIFFSVATQPIKQIHEAVTCPVLEKWHGYAQYALELSCSELLTIRDLSKFCEEKLTNNLLESMVQWENTGERLNPCAPPLATQP